MAIVNITPDSFSDAVHHMSEELILDAATKHLQDGADIIDLGGCSTRPGAAYVDEDEEWRRIELGIRTIRRQYPDVLLSIDTFRSRVAAQAIEAGADIINDISGGQQDPDMFNVMGQLQVPYVLTHTRGNSQDMVTLTHYDHLVGDILDYFARKTDQLERAGVRDIILDPGFGFAKTVEQNYQLLTHMEVFRELNCPILAGISRKSMLYKPLGITPQDALNATTAMHMVALQHGAKILRVHDVREAKQVIQLHQLCHNPE